MNKIEMVWKRHGATILTCVGGCGVIFSNVLTARATIKAVDIMNQRNLPVKEKAKKIVPKYIPAAITTVAALSCIFGSNALNKKQQIALAGVCASLTSSLTDYKKYTRDILGDEKATQVENAIVDSKTKDYVATDGYELYFDSYSGKWFEARPEDVVTCLYEYNRLFQQYGIVSKGEFYRYIAEIVPDKNEWLDPNDWDEVGYCQGEMQEMCDVVMWLDCYIDDRVTKEGKKYHDISFLFAPSAFYLHPEWIDEGWYPGPTEAPYNFNPPADAK